MFSATTAGLREQPGVLLRGYRLSVSVPKIIFFLLSILKTSSNFTQIQVEPHLIK